MRDHPYTHRHTSVSDVSFHPVSMPAPAAVNPRMTLPYLVPRTSMHPSGAPLDSKHTQNQAMPETGSYDILMSTILWHRTHAAMHMLPCTCCHALMAQVACRNLGRDVYQLDIRHVIDRPQSGGQVLQSYTPFTSLRAIGSQNPGK